MPLASLVLQAAAGGFFAGGLPYAIGPGLFIGLFVLIGVGPVLVSEWIIDRRAARRRSNERGS